MLELRDLVGGYGNYMVLRDVSLKVPDGTVVALLGANGAGKSTTLRMASGLLTPQKGAVFLDGTDVTRLPAWRRSQKGLCHIFEGRGVFPSLTVRENLLLQVPGTMREKEVCERAFDAFPHLSSRRHQAAGTMSGGEQQMLALVRAYVTEPRIVLVDEASLGLAPIIVDEIFVFLERLATSGIALLIVEQYINRALAIASNVYVLHQGEIIYEGPAGDVTEEAVFAMYSRGASDGR